MNIEMNRFGRSLVTRAAGRAAYDEISEIIDRALGTVVFDFADVEVVTNSFADEVFGRLVYERGMDNLRSCTTFRNIAPLWASVVRSAMDAREADRLSPVC